MGACSTSEPDETVVKIAFIDPLSGPLGDLGRQQLQRWQGLAHAHNAHAATTGIRFEVVGFDNRGSPQESVNTLKVVVDQGFRYVVQGSRSGVAQPILETLNRHNSRSPGREAIYLNDATLAPAPSNEPCSLWHFRVDADSGSKAQALAWLLRDRPDIHNVFLINPNNANGQQLASHFKAAIAQQRPDVVMVGDARSLEGLAAQIQSSGAHAVVSGLLGADLAALVQALHRAGLKLPVFMFDAAMRDTPDALPNAEVYLISAQHSGLELLGRAMAQAQSTEPSKVLPVLNRPTGLWLSRWQSTPIPRFVLLAHVPAERLSRPETCVVQRP
jgi:branched-chain amino acid transport system substrate-binding protein